ncbi:hypothetical protein [Halorubrum saccharovorum]|uniref:hypothetical protein n=1 Tax=Halorubrum saccharovorum TaxID=2248 RepID=UPI000677E95E|nr:hypothetical protein [Halorubrum saccharovorum]
MSDEDDSEADVDGVVGQSSSEYLKIDDSKHAEERHLQCDVDDSGSSNDTAVGKTEYPDNIDQTTQGHPDQDDMDIIDEPDPNAGKIPYPDEVTDKNSQ